MDDHDAGAALARLLHGGDGVRGDPPPHDGALKDGLQQRERLADRRLADAGVAHLGLESLDNLGRDPSELHAADAREDMAIPEIGVDLLRLRRQGRLGVDPPPLPSEVGERLAAGVDELELAEAPSSSQFGVERLSVASVTKSRERFRSPSRQRVDHTILPLGRVGL